MKITAVILTKNEEKNIERCLKSLNFTDEIIIVDDYSEDKTIDIIQKSKIKSQNYNSKFKIFERKLNGDFAGQRNFGLNKASNDWVLFIDADETVSEELKKSIKKVILNSFQDQMPKQVRHDNEQNAYFIQRRDFFWGKELKFGEVRKVRNTGLIRLVHKKSGQWLGNVHEIFHTAENTGKLEGFINHYPHPSLSEFIRIINLYSSLRSEELFRKNKKAGLIEITTWPLGKFIFNYFLNLGFLDGAPGFVYAFLMSFHSFLVRIKLYQLNIGLIK